MSVMGAPIKEIDFKTLDTLLGIFCTQEECAAVLDVDEDTLTARIKEKFGVTFSVYAKAKMGTGKVSLRRKQYELATRYPQMAIWLGKQFLGQKDVQKLEVGGPDGSPLPLVPPVIIFQDKEKDDSPK